MIYNVNISLEDIIKEIISNFYMYNDFTLTVKAVNDAPVLLQPFGYLSILGDSGAASVVHRSM